MDYTSPMYKDLISQIDIKRALDSVVYFDFAELAADSRFHEFSNDINLNNDSIELSLIKNRVYREAVIFALSSAIDDIFLLNMIREEQKTFGGSKIFYLNDKADKILVLSTKDGMEPKLNMAIARLNKINEKIARLNYKIKKENMEAFVQRQKPDDKKERLINIINTNLKT